MDEHNASAADVVARALRHRATGGAHRHHRYCIHNLPPEDQVAVRGRTVEWWTKVIGPLPVQITPEQWEIPPGPEDGHGA